MKSEIQIFNRSDCCRIDIEGTIGVPEEWQFDQPEERVATYERFRNAVQRIARIDAAEVVVNIRSTGGDVNDALLIHDALCQLPARITTRCYGYTASAATIIAQAASEGCREISANALYLIHRAVCAAEGNAAEMAARVDLLHQTDARLAAVYAARSGRPAGEFEALMGENNGAGRWLAPQEAVEAGLADRIIRPEEPAAPSLVRNLARGWERLLASVGYSMPERSGALAPSGTHPANRRLPADRNVLHPDRTAQERQLAASEQRRSELQPTRTLPREDPSYGEVSRTANERAYAEDAKRLWSGLSNV